MLGVGLGLLAGTLQATRPRSFARAAISLLTAFVLSTPVYWIGLLLLLLFAPGVGSVAEMPFFSTVGGYRAPVERPAPLPRGHLAAVPDHLRAAGRRLHAHVRRQLRGTLDEDFVRTARGKGVRGGASCWRHALRASAAPVIALVGVNMNLILTNIALVEIVFNIPGGYRYIERALVNRDVDLVQALVLESTFFIVVANFLADAIQGWLDPRVRTGEPSDQLGRRGLLGPVAVQAPVRALAREQLVVRALLDDPAVVEHDDLPGAADRRQAVGDHDRRAPGEQPPHALLDPALGVDVDVRGRLVEHEDPRVGDQRARERDELALAGRELDAALADLGVVAVLERRDEVVRADRARPPPRSRRASRRARPNARLSRIVPLNRNASCGTIPICARSERAWTSRRSCPSTRTRPSVGS